MLKLKIGKKYITRCGAIATIQRIDMTEKHPVRGYARCDEKHAVYLSWTLDGRWHIDETDDEFDIIAEENKKKVKKKKKNGTMD